MVNPVELFSPALRLYSKGVVIAVLLLIFLGGLVTSWGAGMAVPDWPLSFGSINPNGWWSDFPVRLEHGHRLFASVVGVLTMLLCAWVWRNKWLIGTSGIVAAGLVYSFVAGTQHQQYSSSGMLHASLWIAGIIFAVVALFTLVLWLTSPQPAEGEVRVRWLAYLAFVSVCAQATLGGLRVTGQTSGAMDLALALRIFHGCVAQAYLCLIVAVATLIALHYRAPRRNLQPRGRSILGWICVSAIFMQLIAGATMRHLGAGLAIPTFPAANGEGGLLPLQHNTYVDLNFTHTRLGASLVTILVVSFAVSCLRRRSGETQITWPAAGLLLLVGVQVTLGIFVLWHTKPPTLTTFHVLNGALLLATALLLTLRLPYFGDRAQTFTELSQPENQTVPA